MAALPVAGGDSAWSVRVWQFEDGLPNNSVTSVAQTRDGFLWVATPTHLARFDGIAFEEFSSRDLVDSAGLRVSKLLSDRAGGLWLALDRGPLLYLDIKGRKVFTNDVPNLAVESLTEAGDGAIWLKNSGGNVVCRVQNGRVTQLPLAGGFRSLARDSQGRIWFSNNGQIGRFHDGHFETVFQLDKTTTPTRLAGSKSGGIWIVLGAELFHYDEGQPLRACGTYKSGPPPRDLTEVIEDRTGAVWIGTSDSGLFRYDGSGFENIPTSHRQILSLLEDSEGHIWVGTGGGGLNRIRPRAISIEGKDSGLPFEVVQSLAEDAHGVVWAATQNGLLICRTNSGWHTVSMDTNWPGGAVSCVAADLNGSVWIGTHAHRIYRLSGGRYEVWQAREGLLSRRSHSLLAARCGDLWVGGASPVSLQCLHDGQFINFELPADTQVIRAMVEDEAGDIWVGTSRGQLLRIHNRVLSDEMPPSSGPRFSIRSLLATSDGSLWLGYAGNGLGLVRQGRWSRLTAAQGLYDEHISQIISDDLGWIWFGSDHGIFKVRQQELVAAAEGKISHVLSIHYGQGEGLRGLEATYGYAPCALRGRDGRLWMPMYTGLLALDPAQLGEQLKRPQVLIKSVDVDGNTIARYGAEWPLRGALDLAGSPAMLRLAPEHRRLGFEFTAPSLSAPENIRFQYQLEGFDDGWMDAGAQRRAEYSRLAAGSYHFHVRACNSQGIWSDATTGLSFIVAPFIWQTWWFWICALGVFSAFLVLSARQLLLRNLRLRLRAAEQQAGLEKERTRIARDIHDDIGNLLTKTMLLSGLVQRDRTDADKTAEHAHQISSTVEEVTNSLDEIVWAVNPRNDTLPQLIDYIAQFAVDFLHTAGLRCKVDLPEHPPARAVSAEVRHGLFLVVKEALNNAVRHADTSEVSLSITLGEEALRVNIEDSGRGFAALPDNGECNGLRNMRQRMEEIGGAFEVESPCGVGTSISLTVPWSN